MMEIGVSLGLSPRESVDRFVSILQRAEELGLDVAWVIDSQLAMKDAYIALAIAARETDRIKIGPGVTNLVTRHETVVANAMSTLDHLAPGRVRIGLGAGDSAVYPLGRKPQSVAELRSGCERLRLLIGGSTVRSGSEEWTLPFGSTPAPPIYVAASQPRMLRLAGAIADGVIIMGPSDPSIVIEQLALIDEGVRAAGRLPSEVKRDLWVTIAIGDGSVEDVKSWASAQARWLAQWAQVPPSLEEFRAEMNHSADAYNFGSHLSLHAEHADTISDEFAGRLAVVGDEATCVGRLVALAACGVDQLTLTLLSGGRERRLEQLASVWKALRDSVPATPQ